MAFLEKEPYSQELLYKALNNPVAPFTTNTFEAVFPYLTKRFGKNIPTDLILKVKKIYAIECKDDGIKGRTKQGTIEMKADLELYPRLIYAD